MDYLSLDNVMYSEQVTSYLLEFLNTLQLSGLPSYMLKLKDGVPVLLMPNLDPPRLCNGRLLPLGRNVVIAIIVTERPNGGKYFDIAYGLRANT